MIVNHNMYQEPTVKSSNSLNESDSFSEIFQEAFQYFSETGVNPVSNFTQIISDDNLFNEYANRLCEGMTADDTAQMQQILENARTTILQESTVNQITPLVGLSMPTVRKMWAKCGMKNAIPTETAKIPAFTIPWMEPYVIDANGTKHYLPEALRGNWGLVARKGVTDAYLYLEDMATTNYEFNIINLSLVDQSTAEKLKNHEAIDSTDTNLNTTAKSFKFLSETTPADRKMSDALDPLLYIWKVKYDITYGADSSATTTVPVEIECRVKPSMSESIEGVYHAFIEKTVTVKQLAEKLGSNYTEGTTKFYFNGTEITSKFEAKSTIFGCVDLRDGKTKITSVGTPITAIQFKGYLSHENNERTCTVGFDIRRKDVRIGTGEHIDAPLPIEFLQDNMALYNIDGTVETVELMSNVVAQRLDMEIIDFFADSFTRSGMVDDFTGAFDCKPAMGYNGSPTQWRAELKTTLEWWAQKIQSYRLFEQGYFVVFGHPLDINLLQDVQWEFKSVSSERNGVRVKYDLGAMTGNNSYQIVASNLCNPGTIRMFFVPTTDKWMTYKYYPYTFNIERGYRDANNPNVPNIMMTKRHTIDQLIPMQVRIDILHNDGRLINTYQNTVANPESYNANSGFATPAVPRMNFFQ